MSTPATTLDRDHLRTTIADVLDVDEDAVTDDAHFIEDLGVDSLMALEVMVILEKKYQVKLAENELKQVTCFDKVYNLLSEKLAAA